MYEFLPAKAELWTFTPSPAVKVPMFLFLSAIPSHVSAYQPVQCCALCTREARFMLSISIFLQDLGLITQKEDCFFFKKKG